ncbi:MAG: glycosyltransferase [Phycisphaerales bacterium]
MSENRLLILLNPGKQSRHYMLGLARSAARLQIPHACLEMHDLWAMRDAEAASRGVMAACVRVQFELSRLVRKHRITHVLGYAWNGALDFGLLSREPGEGGEPVFAALGVRHVMLWTDHPDWFSQGAALRPEFARRLDHPLHTHILKSRAAAEEVAGVLGWRNTMAMPMAEGPDRFTTDSGREHSPVHDVVAIMGGVAALSPEVAPFLDHDHPDPREMDLAVLPAAMTRWRRWVAAQGLAEDEADPVARAGEQLLKGKLAQPTRSYWSLSEGLSAGVAGGAIGWLKDDPQRWYGAVAVLRRLGDWRRSFYPAWLARRLDLGLYGCCGAPAGIRQTRSSPGWVEYEDQAAVYRRGRVALNINAAHDEEGLSHKPFQIASSGVACVHHRSSGLEQCFEPGREVTTFGQADELLDAIRQLVSNPARAREMGKAMQERAMREHTWDQRLVRMLEAAGSSATEPAVAMAA